MNRDDDFEDEDEVSNAVNDISNLMNNNQTPPVPNAFTRNFFVPGSETITPQRIRESRRRGRRTSTVTQVQPSAYLTGEAFRYGRWLAPSSQDRCERIIEELKKKNIDKVINSVKHFAFVDLTFFELTMIINPVISDGRKGPGEGDTIQSNGYKIVLQKPYDAFNESCERIKFKEKVIADYYRAKNLIILYYNPFPFRPRIKECINNINLLPTFTKVDNSKEFQKVLLQKNASMFVNTLKKNLDRLSTDQENLRNEIDNFSRRILVNHQTIRMNVKLIESTAQMISNFTETFLKNVDEIKELPFIEKVEITQDGIKVTYGDIYIHYMNHDYYIGNFYVLIKPDRIEFYNTNNAKDNYDHPHVTRHSPCFGSYNEDVYKLLGNLDLKRLCFLLYQYLKSYNPQSPYRQITSWKEKTNRGEK